VASAQWYSPRSNQGPPQPTTATTSPQTNLPDQSPPPTLATPSTKAAPAPPPRSSLAAAAVGAPPASTLAAMATSAASPKAGAAGPLKTPPAQKAPLQQQQLQTIVKSHTAKNPVVPAGTTASQPVTSAPTKAVTSTPVASATATATPQSPSAGTSSKPPTTAATTGHIASAPAPTLKVPLSHLHKMYFDIQIPLTPKGNCLPLLSSISALRNSLRPSDSAMSLPFSFLSRPTMPRMC